MLTVLTACDQKEIEIPGGEMCIVDVRFLWTEAEGASPEGMSVFFYPAARSGQFWRFDIAGKEGGFVEIPEGVYTMLAVNNDLSGVELEDISSLSGVQAVQSASEKNTSLLPAGILFRAGVKDLTISRREISYISSEGELIRSGKMEICCCPDSASTVYNLVFTGITGLERVKSAEAVLSGCAGGIYLASMTPLDPGKPLTVEMTEDVGNQTLTGSSTGFRCDSTAIDYEVALRLRYHDGGLIEKKFNIERQSVNTSDSHSVYIVIKDMKLPESAPPDPDAVGIGVGMDGWNTFEIDLESETF